MKHENQIATCAHCKSPLPQFPKGHCGGTGYATLRDTNEKICYPCADSLERETIANAKPGDKTTLYLSSDGKTITTWTGGKIMRHVHLGALHPWSRERRYLSAIDSKGRKWSGIGAEGMYTHLKLCNA
jgi:hypothetical protein